MVNWMKTKGVNIRNNEEINKGEGVNEEKTLTNFSNFDQTKIIEEESK